MEPVQEGEDTQFAEVCYMSNGQGGYNKGYYNYKSNPAMSYRNTDVANPQDQVYPQQQQARSSQAPQHGYGPKNNYQGPQGTFPGQQMHIPPGFPRQPPQPAPTPENETSSTTYSTTRSSFPTRPAKLQLDRAEKSTVKPEKCSFPLDFPLTLNLNSLVFKG
ncbi:unnamed protein product [Microthlaspi erraticum]|uniref:Uncharacterized protein n=1 Tax=Microthlaspi erraticum TaxID=1685480 RepID=A0A6D2HMZ1_9BRAS|nr:unnamed protein product [Microthlaspi erraticum]